MNNKTNVVSPKRNVLRSSLISLHQLQNRIHLATKKQTMPTKLI